MFQNYLALYKFKIIEQIKINKPNIKNLNV